mgnify:CR=1 FL=1
MEDRVFTPNLGSAEHLGITIDRLRLFTQLIEKQLVTSFMPSWFDTASMENRVSTPNLDRLGASADIHAT